MWPGIKILNFVFIIVILENGSKYSNISDNNTTNGNCIAFIGKVGGNVFSMFKDMQIQCWIILQTIVVPLEFIKNFNESFIPIIV